MNTCKVCAQDAVRGTPWLMRALEVAGAAVLAVVLSVMLGQTATQSAWAADSSSTIEADGASASASVVVNSKGTQTLVYYVTVAWPDLNYTYTFSSNETWNPQTHQYEAGATGSPGIWAPSGPQTIKVTNDSNTGVDVQASFSEGETGSDLTVVDKSGVTLKMTNAQFALASAIGTAQGQGPSGSISLTVSGIPASTTNPVLTQPITITITKSTTS